MFHYKGLYCWYNDLQGKWLIQDGTEIVSKARTIGAAKANITKYLNRYEEAL